MASQTINLSGSQMPPSSCESVDDMLGADGGWSRMPAIRTLTPTYLGLNISGLTRVSTNFTGDVSDSDDNAFETPEFYRGIRSKPRTVSSEEVQGMLDRLRESTKLREREVGQREWIKLNAVNYDGQWVALVGNYLVASNRSLKVLSETVKERPDKPLLVRVSADKSPMIGG